MGGRATAEKATSRVGVAVKTKLNSRTCVCSVEIWSVCSVLMAIEDAVNTKKVPPRAQLNEVIPRQAGKQFPATAIPTLANPNIAVYWHIFARQGQLHEARLDAVLTRQFAALDKSGLLAKASGIYLGLVGEARPPALGRVLRHPLVRVAAKSTNGFECVTTDVLHAQRKYHDMVLYMHSRGATHVENTTADQAADDWTILMEYMLITHWRYATWRIAQGASTVGAELWCHERRVPDHITTGFGGDVCHYSGNFW